MATMNEKKILENQILKAVAQDGSMLTRKKITAFLSVKGNHYGNDLMVVGRAVNGWIDGKYLAELKDIEVLRELATSVYKESKGSGACPMDWVSDQWNNDAGEYDTNKSAFWRVVRKTIGKLESSNTEGDSWPSKLVWSNLYKVAPEEGGNPGKRLSASQLDGCINLMKLELQQYQPRRLLLLTGLDWAEPFVSALLNGSPANSSEFVEWVGSTKLSDRAVKVVVAVHPQGRKETPWAEEVSRAFGN